MTRTRLQHDPESELHERVCRNLAARCRIVDDERLLVAVSGGSDSVALLLLLLAAQPRFGYEIIVAHFDHVLRPDSAADAHFVRALGAAARLHVEVGIWDAPRRGEAAARQARHAFLHDTARRLGCTAIVLGHQLDDQIETVLLRLGRGSGPRGLGGMHWRRRAPIAIVRPLLDCRRDELVAYLERAGQTWRCDPTNVDLGPTRNRVRHWVLPALDTALGPGWRERWSTAFAAQRELAAWLRRTSARTLERAGRAPADAPFETLQALDLATLRRLAEPRRRAVLQLWLDPLGTLGLAHRHLVGVSELVRNGRTGQRLELPGALLRVEAEALVREHTGYESAAAAKLRPRAETSEPFPFALEVASIDPQAALHDVTVRNATPAAPIWYPTAAATVVGADHTSPPFGIRNGVGGERVRLLGAPGSRPLRRILQDKQVPPRLRRGWPVVADRHGIVWIPGVGIAERCRLDSRSAQAFRLRLRDAENRPSQLAEVHDET